MKEFFKKVWKNRFWRLVIGASLGAVAGITYYTTVGCSTGTCPITSNPIVTTLYGSIIGSLAVA